MYSLISGCFYLLDMGDRFGEKCGPKIGPNFNDITPPYEDRGAAHFAADISVLKPEEPPQPSENEAPYANKNPSSPKTPHPVQQLDPWNRLHGTPTLASMRREVWYSEPEVSRDSLDFNLTSLYNHHGDLLKGKSEVVLHKETVFHEHRVLKGLEPMKECTVPPIKRPTSRGICVRHWVNPAKESIHSIEGAIESPHTAATNSGYSRKENGGIFYH